MRSVGKIASALHAPSAQTIARAKGGNVDILDEVALQRFLSGLEAAPFATLQAATYWRALVATLVYSGMRLGELCVLQWSDVDFKGQLLSVRDSEIKATKTE